MQSKREADLGLKVCGTNSKWGQVHRVELDFRKMWKLVSHFSEVVWIFYEFMKLNLFSKKEKGRGEPGLDTWQRRIGPAVIVADRWAFGTGH